MEPRQGEDEGESGRVDGGGEGTQARGQSLGRALSYCPALSPSRSLLLALSQNKDLLAERSAVQSKFDDLQEQVEHSLLDKEIAESELEDVQARVKELEEQLGEVQVELEVVKEENGASGLVPFLFFSRSPVQIPDSRHPITARLENLGDAEIAQARAAQAGTGDGGEQAPSTAPSSLAFRQLEKQNARLKEALLRCETKLRSAPSMTV